MTEKQKPARRRVFAAELSGDPISLEVASVTGLAA
jgi:hypothetical protein